MADVVLGTAGDDVVVDVPVCAKTGRRTDEMVTFKGSTTPGWVIILLFLTIVGFLLAAFMTQRSYRVTVPFVHEVHDRWRRGRRLAWLAGLVGVACVVGAVATYGDRSEVLGAAGIVLVVAGLVGSAVNGVRHGVGFRLTRGDQLEMTRVHPAFAAEVRQADRERTRA